MCKSFLTIEGNLCNHTVTYLFESLIMNTITYTDYQLSLLLNLACSEQCIHQIQNSISRRVLVRWKYIPQKSIRIIKLAPKAAIYIFKIIWCIILLPMWLPLSHQNLFFRENKGSIIPCRSKFMFLGNCEQVLIYRYGSTGETYNG